MERCRLAAFPPSPCPGLRVAPNSGRTFGSAGLCVADALCDRHDRAGIAFTLIEPDLTSRVVTYGELRDLSARLAAALTGRGVRRGDRVAVLMGKRLELVVSLLAIWR